MDTPIPDLMAPILTGLGLPAPTNILQTMLMHDGYFVGWKLRYDGGCAVLRAGANTVEFYDEQDKLLKTVVLDDEKGAAA